MTAPTTQELLDQYMGKMVPFSLDGGFVCLSFAISLVGTGTALELIRRRTSHRGLHNILLLVGAAIAMGGIAIWSMHFIGNRAIYMLDGQEGFQIAYSPSLTVMSLLVPICALILAFFGVNGSGRVQWWRTGLAGLLSGGAICGMHYLADSSISNYNSFYQLSYLIGSVVIAVLASTIALTLFFVFESTWKNAWWKRIGCAIVLAFAVSGMHWFAAVGTSYKLLSNTPGKGLSRHDAMVVVICLAIAASIVMIRLAVYSSRARRDYASKSQQVVLAAAVFDENGRIMVSQHGYLPNEVITDTYLPKSSDDIFHTSHPLFLWMFRVSRNWDTITEIMGKITNHISLLPQEHINGRASVKFVGEDGVLVDNYDTIVRELFCLTANALAVKTKVSLHSVGTLWDEIFVSGENSKHTAPRRRLMNMSMNMFSLHSLTEKGFQQHDQEYGRGCLMFLVRKVDNKRQIERLEAAGFRFAEVHQVVGSIRSSMHIKTPDLEARLCSMSNQKDKTPMFTPGVHVAMFAVRARLDKSGFDVLAQKAAKNLLPSLSLATDHLLPGHTLILNSLRGMTLANIILRLDNLMQKAHQEKMFASDLRNAISALRDFLGVEIFDNATLLPKEVQLPCSANEETKPLSKCTLIAFQLMFPIHGNVVSSQCEFTPLNLFKMRQVTYDNSSHHLEFSHMVHLAMSSVTHDVLSKRFNNTPPYIPNQYFARGEGDNLPGKSRHKTSSSPLPLTKSREQLSKAIPHPSSLYNSDYSSFDGRKLSAASHSSDVKDLDDSIYGTQSHNKQSHAFGGIVVSQRVSINVQEIQKEQLISSLTEQKGSELVTIRSRADSQSKGENCCTATAAGKYSPTGQGKQPEAAFVDELLALSIASRKAGSRLSIVT